MSTVILFLADISRVISYADVLSLFFNARLLGTPNEEVWPGVGKLRNWHEYPQWNVSKLSSVVPSLGADGIDLLEVRHHHVHLY